MIIVGNNGKILRSTNLGQNYTIQASGTNADLKYTHSLNNIAGYIVGTNGTILKTTDNGATWTQQSSGTTVTLNSVFVIDNQKAWITGNNGLILHTTDGGATWQHEQITPPINLNSIYFFSAENGVIAGDGGLILNRQVDVNFLPYINLAGNSVSTWISNKGIFNQDTRTLNTPGLQWPVSSGKFAMFTSGFTISAYVNNEIRMAAASYGGEYKPGYCENGIYYSDSRFRFYKIKAGENAFTNSDWLKWIDMVPFGAPYADHNNNGIYEPYIDTPGVRGAAETIFLCMTDADPVSHHEGEGFGGGTQPLGAEVHLTAWSYNSPGLQDVQFLRWQVVNKSNQTWNSTYFSLISDPDLGDGLDDYIGCDTTLELSFCYNADNIDGDGSGITYGFSPPAVGFRLLRGAHIIPSQDLGITSFGYFSCSGCTQTSCEASPGNSLQAYNFIKGSKNDGTPWVNPLTLQPTKYTYSGDPETLHGWTESHGRILNCGGGLTGTYQSPVPPGDRRMLFSTGDSNLVMVPGAKQTIVAAQMIARGSTHLNSVTNLKRLSVDVKTLYGLLQPVNIDPVSEIIPLNYRLYQNYPNPFNPVTNVKFDIPQTAFIKLTIYDLNGREVTKLINEQLSAGSYNISWDAIGYASGVYFYKLETEAFQEVKRMILVK